MMELIKVSRNTSIGVFICKIIFLVIFTVVFPRVHATFCSDTGVIPSNKQSQVDVRIPKEIKIKPKDLSMIDQRHQQSLVLALNLLAKIKDNAYIKDSIKYAFKNFVYDNNNDSDAMIVQLSELVPWFSLNSNNVNTILLNNTHKALKDIQFEHELSDTEVLYLAWVFVDKKIVTRKNFLKLKLTELNLTFDGSFLRLNNSNFSQLMKTNYTVRQLVLKTLHNHDFLDLVLEHAKENLEQILIKIEAQLQFDAFPAAFLSKGIITDSRVDPELRADYSYCHDTIKTLEKFKKNKVSISSNNMEFIGDFFSRFVFQFPFFREHYHTEFSSSEERESFTFKESYFDGLDTFNNYYSDQLIDVVVVEKILDLYDKNMFGIALPLNDTDVGDNLFKAFDGSFLELKNKIKRVKSQQSRESYEQIIRDALKQNVKYVFSTNDTPIQASSKKVKTRPNKSANDINPTISYQDPLESSAARLLTSKTDVKVDVSYEVKFIRGQQNEAQYIGFTDDVVNFFTKHSNEDIKKYLRAILNGFTVRFGTSGIKRTGANKNLKGYYHVKTGSSPWRIILKRSQNNWVAIKVLHKDGFDNFLDSL